jgi:hypothetical protein
MRKLDGEIRLPMRPISAMVCDTAAEPGRKRGDVRTHEELATALVVPGGVYFYSAYKAGRLTTIAS